MPEPVITEENFKEEEARRNKLLDWLEANEPSQVATKGEVEAYIANLMETTSLEEALDAWKGKRAIRKENLLSYEDALYDTLYRIVGKYVKTLGFPVDEDYNIVSPVPGLALPSDMIAMLGAVMNNVLVAYAQTEPATPVLSGPTIYQATYGLAKLWTYYRDRPEAIFRAQKNDPESILRKEVDGRFPAWNATPDEVLDYITYKRAIDEGITGQDKGPITSDEARWALGEVGRRMFTNRLEVMGLAIENGQLGPLKKTSADIKMWKDIPPEVKNQFNELILSFGRDIENMKLGTDTPMFSGTEVTVSNLETNIMDWENRELPSIVEAERLRTVAVERAMLARQQEEEARRAAEEREWEIAQGAEAFGKGMIIEGKPVAPPGVPPLPGGGMPPEILPGTPLYSSFERAAAARLPEFETGGVAPSRLYQPPPGRPLAIEEMAPGLGEILPGEEYRVAMEKAEKERAAREHELVFGPPVAPVAPVPAVSEEEEWQKLLKQLQMKPKPPVRR